MAPDRSYFEDSTDWEEEADEQSPYDCSLTVDPARRKIYFFEGIEGVLIRELAPALHRLNHAAPDKPIWLHCASPGGNDQAMWTMADLIETIDAPVNLVVYGCLSSAATILFGVCAHRYVSPNTQVTLHAFRTSPSVDSFSAHELAQYLHDMEECVERWARCLAARTAREFPYFRLVDIGRGRISEVNLRGMDIVLAGLADDLIPSNLAS